MKHRSRLFPVVLAAIACLIFQQDAHAYLDPGTGSMVFQALAAVVVGGLAAVKIYWHRIKGLLSPDRSQRDTRSDADESDT